MQRNRDKTRKRATHQVVLSVALRHINWPDPGLTRNTRRCCYRCSVPGLAGFTKLALCGARDLIRHVLAERVGFEPTERFPAHSISSAANSTTLAPLLGLPILSVRYALSLS